MPTMTPDQLLGQLHWRYAVKEFDPAGKVPAAAWAALEQVLVLSASSFGLQPWKFIVVENPALRQQLVAKSWQQRQIVDADKLVVFCGRTDIDAAYVDHFVARIAAVRHAPVESLAGYRNIMLGFAENPALDAAAWASKQVYLALGSFLSAAAVLGVDACPMEGIDPAGYDELLGLAGTPYRTLMVATVGRRAATDKYAQLAKVRFPATEVIERR